LGTQAPDTDGAPRDRSRFPLVWSMAALEDAMQPTRSGFFKKAMKNSAPCYSRQKRPDTGSCSWRRAPPAPAPSTAGGFDRSRNSSSCRLGLYVVTLVLVRVLFRHRATCHRHLPLNTRTEFASILTEKTREGLGALRWICAPRTTNGGRRNKIHVRSNRRQN
jgi:hypothetical protein